MQKNYDFILDLPKSNDFSLLDMSMPTDHISQLADKVKSSVRTSTNL